MPDQASAAVRKPHVLQVGQERFGFQFHSLRDPKLEQI
jgi:hypothetical protein